MCILLNFYHACVRCPVLHSGLSVCVHACFFKLALGKRYRDSFLYFFFLVVPSLAVSAGAVSCLERLVSEVTLCFQWDIS